MAGSDSLNGKAISDTYKDLLQVPNANSGVDGTLRTVMDGEGTESTLQVSTAGVKSTGTLESTGNLTVGGTLTLDGTAISSLEDGATADQTGAQIKTAYEGEADTNAFTDADHTKLNAIAPSATANDTDANLKDRANHTGTQAASTISDFDTEVANNSAVTANTAKVTNATHTGDVTGSGALTIADDVVDEANLKVSNSPTDGYSLVARSGETGGLKWESVSGEGGSGTVTSVGGTGTVSGLTLSGTVTSSGDLTLGGALSANLTSDVTGTLPVANGGTGLTSIATLLNSNTTATDVGLSDVENTALSSWVGSTNLTTLGTVATGTWQGTAITDSYVASAATWNGKQDALTFGITDDNAVEIDSASVTSGDFARFTSSGLEGRSNSEVLSDIGAAASAHNHNSHYLQISNNLSDVTASTARTNLGLGEAAVKAFDTAGGVQAYDADTTKNDVSNSWSAAQQGNTQTAAFSALTVGSDTGVLDFDTYQNFVITLGAGTNGFTNPTTDSGNTGQTGVIVLIQDSSASTATWTSDYKNVGGSAPTLSSGSAKVDVLPYIIQADNTILLGAPQLDFS